MIVVVIVPKVAVLDSLKSAQNKHADIEGERRTEKDLKMLCQKYDLDPSVDDFLNSETNGGSDAENSHSDDDRDLYLDDVSDDSGNSHQLHFTFMFFSNTLTVIFF